MPVGFHSFEAAGSFFVYDSTTNALVEAPGSVHHALDVCRRRAWEPLVAAKGLRSELPPAERREATAWLQDAGRQGMLRPHRVRDYTWLLDADPRKELASLGGLVLGLTERCNFRCRYCTFSGYYPGHRTHSDRSMTWSVLRRSLDFFLPRARRDSSVSFYGGEPALEWELLERAVRYLRRADEPGPHIAFHLTTNGTLIDDRKLDFLIEHDGAIAVSLDGPATVHDRMRRFRNGAASFERVVKSLDLMRARDEAWYRSHVNFNCVICRREDLASVLEFFGSHELVRDMPVKAVGLHEGMEPSQAQALELGPTSVGGSLELPEMFLAALAGRNDRFPLRLFVSLFRPVFDQLARRRVGVAPTRVVAHDMCYPGAARVYVGVAGELYVCNRIDVDDGRIGDIEHGFDYDRVKRLLRFFVEYCQSACQECWAQRLCAFCASRGKRDGELREEHLAEACRTARERWKRWLLVFAHIWKREEELGVTDRLYSLHSCVEAARREDGGSDPDG
jgi:uncharacterized protein